MAFILGRKLKMTQVWKGERVYPVTVVEAGPAYVTQIKSRETDGYAAVQIGFDPTKKKMTKALRGHFAKSRGERANFRYAREFHMADAVPAVGEELNASLFREGDCVTVSGKSIGRGFQGVVKRHGFAGGPKTHGQKDRHRAPGSIGATAPQRVVPGLRMAGRMGGRRVTVKNLEVLSVDPDKNLLFLKGAVPGKRGTLLEISK